MQKLVNSALKANIKKASAEETKTSTNAEKPLFTRFKTKNKALKIVSFLVSYSGCGGK